ncbi:MAG: hypothetical protein ACREPY_00195 [Rhodanobacteraceae bacterium]
MRIPSIVLLAPQGVFRTATAGMLLAGLMLLAGCGHSSASATQGSAAKPAMGAAQNAADPPHSAQAAVAPMTAAAGGLAARTGALTNPDSATMVYLYYDLAGIKPPIDQWVENDDRVRDAPGADKAAQRVAVKSAIQAGMAAVRGVGVLHLTTNTGISAYDPTYHEFIVGALAPGMAFTFQAQHQTVSLKFDNGLAAQTWNVPADKAQGITDRFGDEQLTLDTRLKIDKVLPNPSGGTIVARVVAWSLRSRDGGTIARVPVPRQ